MTSSAAGPLSARIQFSPVAGDDFDALAEIRIAAMRESLERVGRFDSARARERLRKSFYPEQTWFILLDGREVGFYTFRPDEDCLLLDHLYVHPTSQSQGVGSYVMRRLIAEAEERRMPICLGALRGSASNDFYRRHGFVQTSEDEWDIYYLRPLSTDCKPR